MALHHAWLALVGLLLPLNGAWWLRRDIVHDSVDLSALVADPVAHVPEEGRGERVPVCGHAIAAGDCTQSEHVVVCALVALDAH